MNIVATLMESLRSWSDAIIRHLPAIAVGIIVFFIFIVLAKVAGKLVQRFLPTTVPDRRQLVRLIIRRLVQWSILIFGLLTALSVMSPSFRTKDFIQLLGISGVAIGFAFKDLLQNFLAGIILMLIGDFNIGDELEFEGFKGQVKDIRARATYLRADEKSTFIIPNSEIFTKKVKVTSASQPPPKTSA
jgi:small conductance mechanosensitive channel